MPLKTLSDFNFKGKTVLLRTDINSDVVNKKVLMSERIKQAAVTIKELVRKKAKVVIIAHQGNPGKSDFLSLRQHAILLNKIVKVKFVKDIISDEAVDAINSLNPGEAVLLENIRLLSEEFHPGKNRLVQTLVPLMDIYVNDAFSVCHRKHTSIVSFPKYLPYCAGRTLEKEVKALKKIKIKKCLYILGGAKPEDNIKLLKGNKVLACGLFGQVCLIAKGKKLGAQEHYLEREKIFNHEILERLKKKLHNVEIPLDFAVKFKDKRIEIPLSKFPNHFEIFDIGGKTIEKYTREIKNAKAIYMKGPAGFTADKKFAKGTIALLKAVSECKGFTLIGGGHLSDAIKMSKIPEKKFKHISLSGGALLSYIAGEKLPGLVALGVK